MAEVTYRVCDRCGDKMDPENGWISRVSGDKHINKINLRYVLTGYVTSYSYELCSKCTKELENFLENYKAV